jgi:hypothetical protein
MKRLTLHRIASPFHRFNISSAQLWHKAYMVAFTQSWARAFFYASRLRFRALWRSSSRWRFRALFWALNFALLHPRFRAPALLEFSCSFFALLDFSRFFSRSSIFCARTFALTLSISREVNAL